MRPSLLPGLLAAVQRNRNRGFADLGLFEVGPGLSRRCARGPVHRRLGVRAGAAALTGAGRHWAGSAPEAGLYDAKADVVALLAALGFDAAKAQTTREAPAWFHPGRSGRAASSAPRSRSPTSASCIPRPCARSTLPARSPPSRCSSRRCRRRRRKGLARAPLAAADLLPVRRDFAFVLDAEVPAGDVVRAALSADKKLIAGVSVFDVFEGESLGAGKKSLALEVTLQPTEKTLTDEEIEAVAGA